MPEPTPHRATVQDLIVLPEDNTIHVELVGGTIYTSPRPRSRHSYVESMLTGALVGPFHMGRGGPGGWWILFEPLVRFGPHDATAPDLAGWRRERVPAFPEEFPIEAIPDWVCEVLSPSTARRDRTAKTELYAARGVDHLWVVDPVLRTLEAFRNHEGAWLRLGAWTEGDRAAIAPFTALELDVGGLFPPRTGPDFVAEETYAP